MQQVARRVLKMLPWTEVRDPTGIVHMHVDICMLFTFDGALDTVWPEEIRSSLVSVYQIYVIPLMLSIFLV